MKRFSKTSALIVAVVLALLGTSVASADAQLISSPLTVELDLTQLPNGPIPRTGIDFNNFLTISSIREDARIIDGEPDYATGAIGLFPGQLLFDFDVDQVEVLSFSYEILNNNAPSFAFGIGSAGASSIEHPEGLSSQSFEGVGSIGRVEMTGIDAVIGAITIEFIGTGPDQDSDGDGVLDRKDNCTVWANADQRDSDRDSFGNRCDADLNNDGWVNFLDLARFRNAFGAGAEAPEADFDGNGDVDLDDLEIMKSFFFGVPGPSAVV